MVDLFRIDRILSSRHGFDRLEPRPNSRTRPFPHRPRTADCVWSGVARIRCAVRARLDCVTAHARRPAFAVARRVLGLSRWRSPIPSPFAWRSLLHPGRGVFITTRITTPQAPENFIFKNRPNSKRFIDVSALSNNPAYFWLSLTLVSFVVAGLREELWRSAFLAGARALWPGAFGSRGGQIAAAALAAVVFGLGHLPQGLLAVCMTGLLGFVLGVIMILHPYSIWLTVIAHGAHSMPVSLALIVATDLMHKSSAIVNGGLRKSLATMPPNHSKCRDAKAGFRRCSLFCSSRCWACLDGGIQAMENWFIGESHSANGLTT